MKSTIDGYLFEKMIKNGLENIKSQEKDINSINVFPVTDGDTGSNMRVTLENGINNSKSETGIGSYLESLSKGMLFGARGNSGMILSQLFKGIYKELKECEKADVIDIKDAFIRAYQTAYKAVINPVEGTILTVSREGIENIYNMIDDEKSIEEFLEMYIDSMKTSLDKTPELLPVLSEYSVVDSGGVGYIAIVEGMYKTLCDEDSMVVE